MRAPHWATKLRPVEAQKGLIFVVFSVRWEMPIAGAVDREDYEEDDEDDALVE